jgi:stage II sporulation protein D
MRNTLLLLFLAICVVTVNGQPVRIGIFNEEVVRSVVVYCTGGEYTIWSGEQQITAFEKGDIVFASLKEGMIQVYSADQAYGSYRSIEFRSPGIDASFRLRPTDPALGSRSYDDDLLIGSGDAFLSLINQVDMDKYLAGVVESEVGPNAEKEFYKAQALLARTYLLSNFERHREEGFSLCDAVHCQAFKGRAIYNPDIPEAVFETTGEVIADYHYRLIDAVFHSNSGGETQRSADVWIGERDYLQAVIDPYSLHQPNAKWYDTIMFVDWKRYLLENGMQSVKKLPDELLYVEQMHRKKFFVLDQDSLLMTKIRKDWNWRSAFFDMFPESDGNVLIWGKGYGHGVGMSQEGAMKMARDGYNYRDIIEFYYYTIRIMNYEDLPNSSLPDMDWRP